LHSIGEYFLFLIIFLVITITGYLFWNLYRENQRLRTYYKALLKAKNSLEDNNVKLQIQNSNLKQMLKDFNELEEYKSKYFLMKGELDSTKDELKTLRDRFYNLSEELKDLRIYKAKTEVIKEQLEEKEALISKLQDELSSNFKNLANELLQKNQESFLNQNSKEFKSLLEPFDKELKSFKEQMEKISYSQNQSINLLRGELMQIKELNKTLSKEAHTLAKALKGDSKLQGNWGEMILERALKACGLREGKEYKKEQFFKGEEKNLRADVIVYLPDNKHIVIDSKVSLKYYTQILESEDKNEIERFKKAHIISLKRHIDTLATKQYHKIEKLQTPEFTLMFIPIEGAYLMALESDSSIFEYAYERGVAVVTPTTLLTTLKTIATLWKLANYDKNMEKLAKEAASLHDKFAIFLEDFKNIELRLNQAVNSYESAKSKLILGQGNIYNKIEKIGILSNKSKKTLPKLEE